MSTEYLVLLYGDESIWENATPEEREAAFAAHGRFSDACTEGGHEITGGAELASSRTARTVRRTTEGTSLTDGPFAETVEQIGGFYLVRTDDVDALAALVATHLSDTAELRPMVADDPDAEEAATSAAAGAPASPGGGA